MAVAHPNTGSCVAGCVAGAGGRGDADTERGVYPYGLGQRCHPGALILVACLPIHAMLHPFCNRRHVSCPTFAGAFMDLEPVHAGQIVVHALVMGRSVHLEGPRRGESRVWGGAGHRARPGWRSGGDARRAACGGRRQGDKVRPLAGNAPADAIRRVVRGLAALPQAY